MGGLGPKMEGFPTPGQEVPGFSETPTNQPETSQEVPETLPVEPTTISQEGTDHSIGEAVSIPIEPHRQEPTTEIPIEIIGSNEITLEEAQTTMHSMFESREEND